MKECNDPSGLIKQLNIPTSELSIVMLQDVLKTIRSSQDKEYTDVYLYKIAHLLWKHLISPLKLMEKQFLCSTCFFNIIYLIKDKNECKIFYSVMDEDLDDTLVGHHIETEKFYPNKKNMFKTLSYIHGIFQVRWPHKVPPQLSNIYNTVLSKAFNLLVLLANRYCPYTFVAFKLIPNYKKVLNTSFAEVLHEKKELLLNLVCLNWENPIPGVRDLNKNIFAMIIRIIDNETYNRIANEINGFVWNKAKYLMLAEILTCDNEVVFRVLQVFPNWVTGVINSLYKPGLVSAGADMYFVILKGLESVDEWSELFYNEIVGVLTGDSHKAINNFYNYWLLNTLKKFPVVLEKLHKALHNNICALLGLMKQGNRLGMINRNWNTNELNDLIDAGLVHINPQIRSAAFDIIATCYSSIGASPHDVEYDLIYSFLVNNVNSDCTVLRINTLNSLRLFLGRVYSYFKQIVKSDEEKLKPDTMYKFCKNIQMLIIDSLTVGGNYQRKITVVKMCNVFLESLHEKKSDPNMPYNKSPLIEALKAENMWFLDDLKFINTLLSLMNDPAQDVKDNVGGLLLIHYSPHLIKHKMIDSIIDNAFAHIKSKFFYEICSGQNMIALATSLMAKEQVSDDCKFNNVEEIFVHICEELVCESRKNGNVVQSIRNGQQLYSYIGFLNTILMATTQYKYDMALIYEHSVFKDLLNTLENVSNQFMNGDGQNSDFLMINELINRAIQNSGNSSQDTSDDAKISDLEQIVLNTMWLNVRATCDLASTIIKCQQDNCTVVERCLDIIVRVLETCRHKGAIESAGTALGNSIRCLTSGRPGTQVAKLPEVILKKKLYEMITTCKMSSVTRRGAGLSIMIHRIVANDARQGKPLFHVVMKIIMAEYHKSERRSRRINDNEKDLPQAIYLHFLTKIVTDSSLGSEVMFYSARLAEIAFDNLTNEKWQIRNAALQLYGALVPKLMGQKKDSGVGDESIGTVASDEFKMHFPRLWAIIRFRLSKYDDTLQSHSDLVPILNMLANSAHRYNLFGNLNKNEDVELFQNFMALLSSPINTVRRLSAQCICVMFPFEDIYETLLVERANTENRFHGYLTLIKVCHDQYYLNKQYDYEFKMLLAIYKGLFHTKHCYLNRSVLDSMYSDKTAIIPDVIEAFEGIERNGRDPGYSTWVNTVVQRCSSKCDVIRLPEILRIYLKQKDPDLHLISMYERIKSSIIPSDVLTEMCKIIMRHPKKFTCPTLLKILYEITLIDCTIVEEEDALEFYNYLKSCNYEVSYKLRFIIPFAALIFSQTENIDTSDIFNVVEKLSNDDKNVDMRLVAAMANNQLAAAFHKLPDNLKILSLKTTIILLQDEDEEVRNTSVQYIQKLNSGSSAKHPFICLRLLMDFDYLKPLFADKNNILVLCDLLEVHANNACSCTTENDNYNPFTNDSSNIYFEYDFFIVGEPKRLIGDLLERRRDLLNIKV